VDDLGLEPADRAAQLAVSPGVDGRPDRADQLGHQLDLQASGLGPLEEVAFGPLGGAGDQGDVVAVAMVQAVDRQEGIFLGPAEDQAGDDVDDAHQGSPA